MIDKIVITLADTGFFNINIGDVHFMHTDNRVEAIRNISAAMSKLAYWPTGIHDLSAPITYEEFIDKNKKKKK